MIKLAIDNPEPDYGAQWAEIQRRAWEDQEDPESFHITDDRLSVGAACWLVIGLTTAIWLVGWFALWVLS